ncbi:MAG: hypothetical protein ACJ76S_07050 [Solirubrobacteraceae bacterium]|jgi:hypothetical protein
MNRYDDDEDWVGTPPEGRHSRDRAKPEFWLRQRPVQLLAAGLGIAIIVVVIVLLSR